MNLNEIKELIETVKNSGFGYFELENQGMTLKLGKEPFASGELKRETKNSPSSPIINSEEKEISVGKDEAKSSDAAGSIVKAPIVGTFYNSSSPEKPPFVKVGDKVKKGQVLCIIEAMKILNEITSEYDGEIAEIYPENEMMVEYDTPLFRII